MHLVSHILSPPKEGEMKLCQYVTVFLTMAKSSKIVKDSKYKITSSLNTGLKV